MLGITRLFDLVARILISGDGKQIVPRGSTYACAVRQLRHGNIHEICTRPTSADSAGRGSSTR